MSHPLDDANLRINWARRRFMILVAEVNEYLGKTQTVRFRQEYDSARNVISVFIAGDPVFPLEWALTVSEILYSCRVALDYLAWELRNDFQASLNKVTDGDSKTMFIICGSEEEFEKQKWHLQYIRPEHIALIREVQPFSNSNLEKGRALHRSQREPDQEDLSTALDSELIDKFSIISHPLSVLSALNNQDKHKILKRVRTQPRKSFVGNYVPNGCDILKTNIFVMHEIEEGAKWVEFEVKPTSDLPSVIINDRVETGVSFGGKPLENLGPIVECVAEILECFRVVLG